MSGSSKSVDIFLRLHGAQKFAKEVEAAGTQLEGMGLKGAKSISAFARSSEKLKSFGKSWTKNVSLPVAGLAAVAGKMAIDFHQSMSLIQTQAGATGRETVWLEKRLLKMASRSKFSADELADSLFRVRSAGFKKGDAMGVLNIGSDLATMGNSNDELTTKALTGAAKTLHLHKLGQIKALGAEMNAIVGSGDMRMEELQDALSTGVLPAFVSASLGMRAFGSALTVMTDRNVPAEQAATRLRMVISLLSAPTEKAQEALAKIGLGSETLARTMKNKGLPQAVAQLAHHLESLPKIAQNQILTEAFGGAKSSGTIKQLVENFKEMPVKAKDIATGIHKFAGELKVAEKQPGTELLKAWHSIEVTMIKIGDELLPAIVPGLKDLASAFVGVAHVFTALPPEVQAAAAAFLILTGPVATGLGFFASGMGKVLVLTAKFARAQSLFGSTMSRSVMTERSGLTGAFGAASEEMGLTGALQTAKGFALSLGPAVAAIGIGNIVTSATSGDWKDAGWEAGGALAGGVAGAIIGGPLGAMLGVGVGSIGGELIEGFFGTEKKLRPLQEKLASSAKGVKKAFGEQRQASKSLTSSTEAVVSSHKRESRASQAVHKAEHALAAIRKKAGPDSQPVLHAENELAKAAHRREQAVKSVGRAERKQGAEAKAYKEVLRYTVLEERHRLNVLGKAKSVSAGQLNAMRQEGTSLQERQPLVKHLMNLNEQLNNTHKKLSSTLLSAANQVGPKYSTFLREAGRKTLDFGSNVKAAKVEVDKIKTSLEEMSRAIGKAGTAFEKSELESRANVLRHGLPGANERLGEAEKHSRRDKGRGKKKTPKAGADSFLVPAAPGGRKHRSKVDGPGLLNGLAKALQLEVTVPVELDGKVAGEATARQSIRKSNRE